MLNNHSVQSGVGSDLCKAILDALSSNVALLNEQGQITDVNQAWSWFSADQIDPVVAGTGVGTNFTLACEQQLASGSLKVPEILSGLRAVLDGSQPEMLVEYPLAQETPQRWFQLHITSMNTRPERGALVSHREVTPRHQMGAQRETAVEQLRESELRYRRLFESAKDGILILDGDDGKIVDANPFILSMLEYTMAELYGKELYEIGLFEDVNASRRAFTQLQQDGYIRYDHMPLASKSGKPHAVEFISNVYRAGDVPVIQCNIREISEARRIEKQAVESQKMEMVGQLAAGIAHDFNNLMTTVIGYSSILIDESAPGDTNKPALDQIYKAGERAALLTRQLLAFSRKQMLDPVALKLDATIKNHLALLHGILGEEIKVELTLEPQLGWIKVDPSQVEQMLMNLIVNARDAMPDGGKLQIETANIVFEEKLADPSIEMSPGPYVMLAISDTGSGMSEKTLEHIFEPFFTTKEVGKGSGLGLAMVDGFVHQSGGFILAESKLGRGSSFRIYIPEIEAAVIPVAPPDSKQLSSGNETILLVEDEEGVRMLVLKILESCGYNVLQANNGNEALRIADLHPGQIDLLLTDVVMPGIGGRDLGELISAFKPEIKIIYMSGYMGDAVIRRGVIASQVPFLQKPFTPSCLACLVREVLDRVSSKAGEHG